MTNRGRTILHVDMDAFFVAVELRRRPELAGQPVVVGGTGGRGVVAAASYEARRYGVHSAMPSTRARRLCPHAVFLPGDHAAYSEASKDVLAIFEAYTPLVEPLSIDEAFLDVTGSERLFGPGPEIARTIRERVAAELDLACSVGVAPNMFLAKLASEAAKPTADHRGISAGAGVVVIEPGGELAFLHPLPVQALWGVGPATLARLQRLGIGTVGQLAEFEQDDLVSALGDAHGRHLHCLAHAIDDREVEPDRDTKSVSHEQTFARDQYDRAPLEVEVVRMADSVADRLRANDLAGRTVTLKVRFASFRTITRSVTLPAPVDNGVDIARAAQNLLAAVDPASGVRLLGVAVSVLAVRPARQLTLDDLAADGVGEWDDATRAVDEIRHRYGRTAIGPATLVGRDGLRVARRGEQQWGPDHDRPEPPPGQKP